MTVVRALGARFPAVESNDTLPPRPLGAAVKRARPPWRRWLWLAVLLLFASGCRAEVEIVIIVEEDGSGTVETTTVLDAEAAERILDLELERDSDGLALTDLAQSGWIIGPPEVNSSGATVITAAKPFGSPSQFSDVMDELTGESGLIRDFRLERTKSFARVDYELIGQFDTTEGLEAFGDPELASALDRSLGTIAARSGASEDDIVLNLTAVLPGEPRGESLSGLVNSGSGQLIAEWQVPLGDREVTDIALSSATRKVSALVLRGAAVVAAVLAGVIVLAQLLRILLPERRGRRNQRRGGGRKPKASEPEPTPEPAHPVTEELQAIVVHRVVALDGMGVLYREADDVAKVLIPFARERGSSVTDDEIEAKARLLSLGRITTGEFWRLIGLEGDPEALDTAYLSRHQLTPGVVKYLRSLRDRGIQVACITNDATAWAARRRNGHSLDGLIDPWVISGSVGVRKPDQPLFEVLRRVTGEAPGSILIVDDDLEILDAARGYGFATAWFTSDGAHEEARDHTIIRSFEVVVDDDGPAPAPESQ